MPVPYNRFLGNPPAGMTAEQAYEAEMGKPWQAEQLDSDKIKELEVKNAELQAQITKLQATAKSK